jgi:hypothetical protein
MLTAACPCGYESKTLYVGCGMAVHAARVPADEDPNPDQTFECPACGQVTATFDYCGIWD